jgi:hypothetical protein
VAPAASPVTRKERRLSLDTGAPGTI